MAFFIEVLITGLLVGIMYSLVALGFALIYKASDVFNFAQGDMSLLAGLALVGFLTVMPLWLALICTIAVMVILAYATVFIIFRPLVARPPLILFMAAIGLSFLIQGIGQSIWGTDAKGLNIGIPDNPIIIAENARYGLAVGSGKRTSMRRAFGFGMYGIRIDAERLRAE